MWIGIARDVSPAIERCELTHLERRPIDWRLAHDQHRRYVATLAQLGVEVSTLPADPELPDSVFVEDVAVVLGEIAILTRPGAASRRPEVDAIARALAPHRALLRIEPPGTVDGGDVLTVGRTIYVGLSSRSNAAAIEQLRAGLGPLGYTVRGVPVDGCLHLKSAETQVAEDTLLFNPTWVGADAFGSLRLIEVDPTEPSAANALRIGHAVIHAASHPRTQERLAKAGLQVIPVEVSELEKAEGAVTCCSLIFEAGEAGDARRGPRAPG
jgi:dimethylargininase